MPRYVVKLCTKKCFSFNIYQVGICVVLLVASIHFAMPVMSTSTITLGSRALATWLLFDPRRATFDLFETKEKRNIIKFSLPALFSSWMVVTISFQSG